MQKATRRCSGATGVLGGVVMALMAGQALACGTPNQAGQADAVVIEHGQATWYGPRHAGHRTSSGAIFDPNKMTAAHHSLALGSWVRVTDDATGNSVVVVVNDREPPHGVRCIDLSENAARRLGIHGRGVADVTLYAATREEAAAQEVEVAEAPMPARRPIGRHATRHRHRAG
jgi:rare lipoprotein A (peptidoglycan hydrolase)